MLPADARPRIRGRREQSSRGGMSGSGSSRDRCGWVGGPKLHRNRLCGEPRILQPPSAERMTRSLIGDPPPHQLSSESRKRLSAPPMDTRRSLASGCWRARDATIRMRVREVRRTFRHHRPPPIRGASDMGFDQVSWPTFFSNSRKRDCECSGVSCGSTLRKAIECDLCSYAISSQSSALSPCPRAR